MTAQANGEEAVLRRLRGIYAAIGDTIEEDLSLFPTLVTVEGGRFSIFQDFTGGMTPEQIENRATMVVYNLANFPAHLRKWARENGKPTATIDEAEKASAPLRLLQDIANIDRHAYEENRSGGLSGRSPRLREVTRALRMSTGENGGTVGMVMTPTGMQVIGTAGSHAEVVIGGTIVDSNDEIIADLQKTQEAALTVCEEMFHVISG